MAEAAERKELTEHKRLWVTDSWAVHVVPENPDDVPYTRADIADGYREALHKARAFMMRQSNDAHERGTAWQLAPEGNTVANEIEEALAKGDEGNG